MPKEKTPLVDKALRDAEGRVRLHVSAPYLTGGKRWLRVFVLKGKSERVHYAVGQKMEDFHDGPVLARTLVALCDLYAMNHGIEYVINNPDRIETLRNGHKRKELSK